MQSFQAFTAWRRKRCIAFPAQQQFRVLYTASYHFRTAQPFPSSKIALTQLISDQRRQAVCVER